MGGDGDGWVHCAQGHRHWGRFGAAGLLIAEEQQAVLQHRAPWTHEGGTWGLPGGARDSHEDVVATALREAHEEAEIEAAAVAPLGWWRDDHGGWSYTTVVAHPRASIHPHAANAESTEIRWWPTGDIDQLPLHRGLAGAWPRLRHPPAPLVVIVDSANVVGARPDGWWRDRLGATRRLLDQLGVLARAGIPAQSLPRGVSPGGLDGMLPGIALVVEGAARPLAQELTQTQTQTQTDDERWWDAAVTVLAAPRDGDTSIVDAANESATAGRQTVVVSADRGLRQRLDDGVHVAGPSWLLEQVTASDLHA
ncbi:MAG TPA: NUDIX domain-containing protein [Jatrophihabitantaceae bacterium]|nr:NUDIX domain-containing protein [Jatrophihabitantaceae bacterium]